MHDDGLGGHIDHAAGDLVIIAHHALYAMGFDAIEIGSQQDISDLAAGDLVKAVGAECRAAECMQLLVIQIMIRHGEPPD